MSIKAMADVFDRQDIESSTDRFILLALVDHSDAEGRNIYPSVERISKKTGFSERTVQYATTRLIEAGALVEDGQGPKGTNKYRYMFSVKGVHLTPKDAVEDEGGADEDEKMLPDAPEPPLTPNKNQDYNPTDYSNEPPVEHPHKAMVAALAEVMGMDLGISEIWKRLGRQAKSLLEADYTPSDVRSAFGKGGYWYKNDWRGKQKQLPDQANINKHIGVYSGRIKVETDTTPRDDYERRLEMLNNE